MPKLPEATRNLISAMRESSPKWDAIVEIIESEKKGINKNILDKKDDEGRDLNPTQIFNLITWHQFLDYVVSLPGMILESAKPLPQGKKMDMEAYDEPLKGVRTKITNE